ncbi:hypothetical protein KR222_000393 [Zaprionus bogoriensis]|nr:hypothetical protein KR222_000393 [Zaprionus bogoriensis]
MGSTRFFLADLPQRTTEQDLRALFQDYGDVERVELKAKEQYGDAGQAQAKIIAFVTVYTEDAQYCLNELNWQQLHGAKLRVSLAKESFLDRLKRERDEGQQSAQAQPDAGELPAHSSRLLAQSTQNKRRVFGEDEEIQDDEIAPELMITKKRAAHSMHNGKIVIQQEQDVQPLHIIEQHKGAKSKQPLDAKAAIADQKRKESLNKMKQQHLQKKSLIQSALSSSSSQAKRIKFSDAEEEEEQQQQPQKPQPKKALFDEEDEEEQAQLLLPQHSGKKGERLVEMQSKQSLDPRFRITANFVGDEEDDDAEEEQQQQEKEQAAELSERNWQMGILEQVIGRKIDTASAAGAKASKGKKMLRFDPAKEEHQRLLRTKPSRDAKEQSQQLPAGEAHAGEESAPVSQSAFYVVTDTLKESLKMRGEGFSLLDMFGSSHDEAMAERKDQLEQLGREKVLVSKSNKLALPAVNPFGYDSSDSEDDAPGEEQQQAQQEQSKEDQENKPALKKGKQQKKKALVFTESFFIPKNDPRLKEGAKLFKSSKAELESENYDEVKKRLKLLITKKIAKSQKHLPIKKGAKKNKNKKLK